MNEIKTVRCTVCGTEFADAELMGVSACPKCGSNSVPCAISEDVSIRINWHELRILVIWAENWAKRIDEKPEEKKDKFNYLYKVMVIAERLQRQFPDKVPLTLFSEIRELRKDYDIETNIDDDSLLEK